MPLIVALVESQAADKGGGGYAESGDCAGCGEVATTDVDLLNTTVTANAADPSSCEQITTSSFFAGDDNDPQAIHPHGTGTAHCA